LARKQLFSKLDIQWGYNNIYIKKGDKWKAVFKTSEGLFKPTMMFFRLTNSSATFQTIMDNIFQKEIAQGWLYIYIDNGIIAINYDDALHQEKIHHFLKKLADYNLFLKPKKCKFH